MVVNTEIKKCWECKHLGYQWSEERERGKRKLKSFFNHDINGKQEIVYYCQNREACGKDKNNIFKSKKKRIIKTKKADIKE